jgi:hypothetical protein
MALSKTIDSSVDIDELFDKLPDINVNIVAVVLNQYGIPKEKIKESISEMIQQMLLAKEYRVKHTEIKSIDYSEPLDRALNRSRRLQISKNDPVVIKAEYPYIADGDIVHLINGEYNRNKDCFIWFDNKTHKLSDRIDNFGNLPNSITLEDFPDPDYFNNSIAFNYIRWLPIRKNNIIEFVPGKYFLVQIDTEYEQWNYKISLSGYDNKNINPYTKYQTKEQFYKSLSYSALDTISISKLKEDGVWYLIDYKKVKNAVRTKSITLILHSVLLISDEEPRQKLTYRERNLVNKRIKEDTIGFMDIVKEWFDIDDDPDSDSINIVSWIVEGNDVIIKLNRTKGWFEERYKDAIIENFDLGPDTWMEGDIALYPRLPTDKTDIYVEYAPKSIEIIYE